MRPNPVVKRRFADNFADKKKDESTPSVPAYVIVILLLLATFVISGCKTVCTTFCEKPKERIVIQTVKVPVAVECPKPDVAPRLKLPSTETLDGPFKDVRGCLMNQEYLLYRVNELESILKVYQNSTIKE
jgi:uncharacterized protein YceK